MYMSSTLRMYIINGFFIFFALFMIVSPVLGQTGGGQNPPTGGGQNPPTGGGQNPPKIELQNPLGNVTLTQFFLKILDIILIFAVPLIIFFIILAGFKYVMARGNENQISEATKALTWALIGGVIILGARTLLTIIQNTVNALKV